jgi:hypothetical protein
MKKILAIGFVALGLAASASAEEFKGFIQDAACSKKPSMKGNAECAKSCIKGGDKAVLVTPEGKVFAIANQDKIVDKAGETVVIEGSLTGDTITVEHVK